MPVNKNEHVLTKRIFISPNHVYFKECLELCRASRMLRNVCLYDIRQHYFETNELFITDNSKKQYIFHYAYLYQKYKKHLCFRTKDHPKINKEINTKVLNQVHKQINNEFSCYFKALKAYNKNKDNFLGKPNIPNYSKDCNITRFPKEAISFVKRKGFVHLSMTKIYLPLGDLQKDQILDVSISPSTYGFNIQISYKEKFKEAKTKTEVQRIAAIDLGLNNLASLTSNDPSINSIIINGRKIKSINHFYNKKLAKYKSELPNNVYTSNKIKNLTQKRNHKILDFLHKSTSYIVDYLVQHKIECLVVGSNKHWKQNINIGKRNNQNFVSIPFYKFKGLLQYKCKREGILYIEREEAYTSKCSFLDLEEIKKHEEYKGRRVKRGLFVSSCNTQINADLNGSYNILRKEFGDSYFNYIDLYKSVHIKKSTF